MGELMRFLMDSPKREAAYGTYETCETLVHSMYTAQWTPNMWQTGKHHKIQVAEQITKLK